MNRDYEADRKRTEEAIANWTKRRDEAAAEQKAGVNAYNEKVEAQESDLAADDAAIAEHRAALAVVASSPTLDPVSRIEEEARLGQEIAILELRARKKRQDNQAWREARSLELNEIRIRQGVALGALKGLGRVLARIAEDERVARLVAEAEAKARAASASTPTKTGETMTISADDVGKVPL